MVHKAILHAFVFVCLVNSLSVLSQNEFTYYSDTSRELYNSGDYIELIDFADAKLDKAITQNDSVAIAKLYFEKAKGFYHKSQQDESIEALKKANAYLVSTKNNIRLKADIMYFFHINYAVKSFILKELEYGQKSLELYTKEPEEQRDFNRILILYRRMSTPNVTIGKYEVAKSYIDKAEVLLTNLPEDHNVAKPLINQIINLGYQKVVVDLIETAFFPDNYDSVSIKKITKRVVEEKKKQDSIYLAHTKLINGKRQQTNSNVNFHSYSTLLNFYCRYFIVNQDKIDFDLSRLHDEIDKSIALLQEQFRGRLLLLYKGNRVDVLTYEKNYDEALLLMDNIIEEAGEEHNRYVNFLFQKAGILFAMGDYEEGKLWIKKGIDNIHSGEEKLKTDYSNFEPGFKLEDVFLMLSMAKKTYEAYPIPNDQKNEELSKIYSIAFKQFLNTYASQPLNKRTQLTFKTLVQKLIEYNSLTTNNLSEIEHVQNKLAWQEFMQSRNVVQIPVVDSLEQVEFTIRKQLIEAKKQRALKKEDSLDVVLNEFKKGLKETYPTISNFIQDNFEIQAFQKKVRQDEAVLKYLFFKDQFVIFQITANDITWTLKPWTSNEKGLLQKHLNSLKNKSTDRATSEALTKILIPEPVFDFKTLTIIPDKAIYFLPFESLKLEGDYLVESHVFRYSSHLRFAFIAGDEMNTNAATIFAPEYATEATQLATRSEPIFLEGAQKEARQLESLFPSQTFIGNTATKENFIKHKAEGKILHLAMHATVDNDNPGLSYFNFSNQEKLYLEELYALKIPSELAVLSACNTAVGKEDSSLSINSLHRAFNYAGTKATIASLWEVPDESTSQIMIVFYEHLKDGQSKSNALQQAKLDYLENTSISKLKHPYYWAGFVLYGDDAPVVEASNYWICYLLGVLILAVILIIFRRKKTS